MKLRLSLLACLVVMSAAFPASALAQKPVKEPVQIDPVEFAAGEVCSFAVRLEPIGNKEQMKTFPSGRVMITGRLSARVTNLATNRSMVVKISGPITFTPLQNGNTRIVARGRNLLILFATDVGGPGLFLTVGRAVSLVDANFNLISFDEPARMTDLCAALA